MLRTAAVAALVTTLVAGAVLAQGVTQPTTIPGDWELYDEPLPPVEQVAAGPQAGRMIYGLYTWAGEYKQYHDGFRGVGWPAYRVAGPMDDDAMRLIVQDDVEIMQTLGLRVHGQSKRRPDYESDEAFVADYVSGIEAYLTRYGPRGTFFKENSGLPHRPIRYIEIWNEPNFQYMIPDDSSRPRQELEAEREALYAKVLPAAYKAVKARWPAVNVVGFGAGGASHGDVRFIRHVHDLNLAVKDSYDVLSTHPYISTPPESWSIRSWGGYGTAKGLMEIREIMAKHGVSKPVWYTEIGWSISQQDGGFYDLSGRRSTVSATLQAAYVCRQYAVSLRRGVQRVHIMFAADTDNTNTGMFNRDGTWRPVAHAIRTMMNMMPNPALLDAVSDGADGYYAYLFRADMDKPASPRVIMAWNVAGPKTVEIPIDAPQVMVTDMLGKAGVATAAGGKVSVEIGPCPVYIALP